MSFVPPVPVRVLPGSVLEEVVGDVEVEEALSLVEDDVVGGVDMSVLVVGWLVVGWLVVAFRSLPEVLAVVPDPLVLVLDSPAEPAGVTFRVRWPLAAPC